MSVNATLPFVYSQQQGPAGRLAHEAATHPEAAQGVSRQVAEALLRKESEQIQKMEESDQFGAVHDEEKDPGSQQQDAKHRRQRQEPPDLNELRPDTVPSCDGPLLGNLVNRKV